MSPWMTEAKAMNFPDAVIKWRISALKVQIISHEQEIKSCELDISRCKHDLQRDETKKELHQFSLKQIAKELAELTALEIENEKAKTDVSEHNLNTVQEATMYTGGVDSLEIMDDPGNVLIQPSELQGKSRNYSIYPARTKKYEYEF